MLKRRLEKTYDERDRLKNSKDQITREYVGYLDVYIDEIKQELQEIGVR